MDLDERKVRAAPFFGITSPLGFNSSSSSSSPVPTSLSKHSVSGAETSYSEETQERVMAPIYRNPNEAEVYRHNAMLQENVETLRALTVTLATELKRAHAQLKANENVKLVNSLFEDPDLKSGRSEVAALQKRVEELEEVVLKKEKIISSLRNRLEASNSELDLRVKPLLQEKNALIQQLIVALDNGRFSKQME
ncbi:hypothetical protein ADEAN_000053300 [Angomonas deanei]|uniref:Uncharacterized protein n=1 Tax=Angomonas deanei TaxID=59799 RepID=A0A7G2C307_9TRYP|nr:hypothetical protein ADEAN_000053300 [Angomonas deanei]